MLGLDKRDIKKLINLSFKKLYEVENVDKELEELLISLIESVNDITNLDIDSADSVKKYFASFNIIKELLDSDLQAAYEGDPAAYDTTEIVLAYPGFYAIKVYRLAHVLYELNIPYIPRMMTEYAHSKTGIDINPGATIGDRFFIDHGTGIVIGETTIIGNHVRLYQGVTLGALSLGRGQALKGKKRHPTIGNDVIIYSGASILGGDTIIGNNVTVGSNTFITESVADNMIIKLSDVQMELINK